MLFHALTIVMGAIPALGSKSVTFVNPTKNGGSFFSNAGNGLGEPLNVR